MRTALLPRHDAAATRRSKLPLTLFLVALGLAGASCVAQSPVVVGETPLPPPAEIPIVSIAVLDELGIPLQGATVESEDQTVLSDDSGMASLEWRGKPVSVSITAEGFFPGAVAVDEFAEEAFELQLRPVVLRGTVTDSSGFGLGGSMVSLGGVDVITDSSGRFELTRAQAGTIEASRPGWHPAEQEWDGEALVTEIALAPRIIRGLHIASNILGDETEWQNFLDIAEDTVVNALVIDVKDETGRIFYNSGNTLARESGAVRPLFELGDVVAEMDRRDLYKIARIVLFNDPVVARAQTDMSVIDPDTGLAYNKRGQFFLDPSDDNSREYGWAIAEEVCRAGFDEIQFDYVRYPDGFPERVQFDVEPTEENRVEVIATFLEEAATRLHPLGCAVAADVFGFITSINNDGGIGQKFDRLSSSVDVLSPMIYPSHYSTGWFGFENPNDHPAGVVGGALDDGMTRLDGPAVVRPWLQDFYYEPGEVRAGIDAAESRALGWMLWNALSNFQWEALTREDPSTAG